MNFNREVKKSKAFGRGYALVCKMWEIWGLDEIVEIVFNIEKDFLVVWPSIYGERNVLLISNRDIR